MKRILVTGGCGYIGSHTCVELIKSGYEVIVIDNLINSYEFSLDLIKKITGVKPSFYHIDLSDKNQTTDFFNQIENIEGVIHFAALKAVGESVEKPLLYYRNNLDSLINLLDGMLLKRIKNIIFSSSCTVYGEPEQVPITENAPIVRAESPYGNTKQISEEILMDLCKTADINVVSLRYFNPAGAHESGLLGEMPRQAPKSLFPAITQSASGSLEKMYVHGSNYPTPDGTAIRDYFHVNDLAIAHIYAFEYLENYKDNNKFHVFNLGSERGYSVMEIINTFEKVNQVKVNYEIGPRRAGDVTEIYADSTKAKKQLGWQCSRSLEDMVKTAWLWEKNRQSIMNNYEENSGY